MRESIVPSILVVATYAVSSTIIVSEEGGHLMAVIYDIELGFGKAVHYHLKSKKSR